MNGKIIVLMLTLILMPSVLAVRIEEVYYDPVATETGGEAIMLYNELDNRVNISGWVIESESSKKDATIPEGTFIAAKQYYLIADVGWNTKKDNIEWDNADYEEAISLTNSDSGIRLTDKNNNTIDRLGWGNYLNISDELYELIPANEVVEGKSLLRNRDTGNNRDDFTASEPKLAHANTNNTAIAVIIEVSDYSSRIEKAYIDTDDSDDDGVQIIPNPGTDREIAIEALLTHDINYTMINATANSEKMTLLEPINSTTAYFSAKIYVSFNQTPANYSIVVMTFGQNVTLTYEIMPLLALELDSSVKINVKDKNVEYAILGDKNVNTTDKPTVKNIGNTPIDLAIRTTGIKNGNNTFAAENIKFSFNNDFNSALSGTLSDNFVTKSINLNPGMTNELGLKFFIPINTQKGSYSGAIIVSAVGVE